MKPVSCRCHHSIQKFFRQLGKNFSAFCPVCIPANCIDLLKGHFAAKKRRPNLHFHPAVFLGRKAGALYNLMLHCSGIPEPGAMQSLSRNYIPNKHTYRKTAVFSLYIASNYPKNEFY